MERLLIGVALGLVLGVGLRRAALVAARREVERARADADTAISLRDCALTNERFVRKRLEQTEAKLEEQYRYRDNEVSIHVAAERDLRHEVDEMRVARDAARAERVTQRLRVVPPGGDDDGGRK